MFRLKVHEAPCVYNSLERKTYTNNIVKFIAYLITAIKLIWAIQYETSQQKMFWLTRKIAESRTPPQGVTNIVDFNTTAVAAVSQKRDVWWPYCIFQYTTLSKWNDLLLYGFFCFQIVRTSERLLDDGKEVVFAADCWSLSDDWRVTLINHTFLIYRYFDDKYEVAVCRRSVIPFYEINFSIGNIQCSNIFSSFITSA